MDKILELENRIKRLEQIVFKEKEKKDTKNTSANSDFSGATGGVRFLISKGFFENPKTFTLIRESLTKYGYHYSAQAAQAALNRLTKTKGPLVTFDKNGGKMYAKRK